MFDMKNAALNLMRNQFTKIWKIALFIGGCYIVLSTILWYLLWSAVIWLAWEAAGIGVPKEERYFRTDAINQPVLNALCDFGNSVIDTFQPMVSDEALISHWKKHRDAMERVAGMAVRGEADFSYLTILPEHLKMLREAGINRLGSDKYSVAIFEPFPALGRVHQIYFCGKRGYAKSMIFYTDDYLPIEMNRRLYMNPDWGPQMEKSGIVRIGANIVDSTDRILTYRNESMVRRLSERWFIYR